MTNKGKTSAEYEVGHCKPPKDKRFSKDNQPSNKAKSDGWKRKGLISEAVKELLATKAKDEMLDDDMKGKNITIAANIALKQINVAQDPSHPQWLSTAKEVVDRSEGKAVAINVDLQGGDTTAKSITIKDEIDASEKTIATIEEQLRAIRGELAGTNEGATPHKRKRARANDTARRGKDKQNKT